jgi:CAAX prenyl protease-like protein
MEVPMFNKIVGSSVLVRTVPFAAFAALTLFQRRPGDAAQYWIYTLQTIVGVWLLWLVRHHIKELKWNVSWESVAVGVAVFVIWVGADGYYPMMAERSGRFNPATTFGAGSAMAAIFIGVKLIGFSLVVPPLEEVFYRSFLYRYLIKSDFLKIPLTRFQLGAFVVAGIVFGIGHYEWLPGIVCAFAYQGLVIRKGRLGDAITAHSITNFLLALWIINSQAYHFW